MWIYLLSVIDGVSVMLWVLTVMFTATGLIALVAFKDWMCSESKREMRGHLYPKLLKAGLTFAVLAALTPNTGSLVRAYAMTEGQKIVTAKNAEKVAHEAIKRVDRLIGALEKR